MVEPIPQAIVRATKYICSYNSVSNDIIKSMKNARKNLNRPDITVCIEEIYIKTFRKR
jgi:hypothetical protein